MKFPISLFSKLVFVLAFLCIPYISTAQNTVTLYVNDCIDSNCNNTPTTTVTNVPTQTDTSGGSGYVGQKQELFLTKILIQQKQTSVIIDWITSTNSISSLSWGTSTNYESGIIGETSSRHNHTVTLKDLQPSTRYYFKIDGSDVYGNTLVYTGSFTTTFIAQYAPLGNIAKPTLDFQNDGLHITWVNLKDPNFNGVRIVRSEYEYPKGPNDGKVVYEGKGTTVIDSQIDVNKITYYAIFATNKNGEYSSGTLFNFNGLPDSGIPGSNTQIEKILLPFSNLIFLQNGRPLQISSSTVITRGTERLIVMLPYDKVPFGLDQVFLSIGTTSIQSLYLMSPSETDEAYEATIEAQTFYPGLYPVIVTGIGATSSIIVINGTMGIVYAGAFSNIYIKIFWIILFINFIDVVIILFIESLRFFHKKVLRR